MDIDGLAPFRGKVVIATWIVPIPGSRKLERLDENLGAVNVALTTDDLREIESEFATITVQGARISEMHMQLIDR